MMKILVVEDERLLADSLQTLLTGRGFSVDTANDGLTGLEYAKTDVYDLVILDVMMPGLRRLYRRPAACARSTMPCPS